MFLAPEVRIIYGEETIGKILLKILLGNFIEIPYFADVIKFWPLTHTFKIETGDDFQEIFCLL